MLHYDAQLDTVLVHAGLAPEWDLATARGLAAELERVLRDPQGRRELFEDMYGDQPSRWSPQLQGTERLRFITNCFTRMRFITPAGDLEMTTKGPPSTSSELIPWFAIPHRRSRRHRIVFGHWSSLGYHESDNTICVDTGCVWGNALCAVRLDRPEPPVYVACVGCGAGQE
jgi:bis(5'-nucleosyl)-tetraphosphatase (symmetrical)